MHMCTECRLPLCHQVLLFCATHRSRHYERRVQKHADSLVIWQGCDVEGLCGARAQGERVCLLLGHEGSTVCVIHIQTERGGQTVGHNERQVFKALQLTGLLMADLQAHSVVSLFQLQRILNRKRTEVLAHAHQEMIHQLTVQPAKT